MCGSCVRIYIIDTPNLIIMPLINQVCGCSNIEAASDGDVMPL